MWCFVSREVILRVSFYRYSSVLVLIILTSAECSPTNRISKRSPPVYDDVLTYLSKYGYLPQSDLETGNLRTDDQLKDAIKSLQSFGKIPITGVVDDKTKELLRRPRCGIPDIQLTQHNRRRKRYTLQGQKWHSTNLTWSLQSRNLRQLNHGQVRYALHKALEVWAKHSKLTFREVNSDNADILIYFERGYHGDGFPFDGRGQVLAHAFFPAPGRGGDAHFDEQELWIVDDDENQNEGTSLFAVAAHEFGHSLGLSHSSVSGALMYPWYQGLKGNFELPEDDRDAIQRLYEVKDRSRGEEYPIVIPERPTYNPKKYPSTEPPKYYPPSRMPLIPSSPMPPRKVPIYTNPDSDKIPNTCDTSYDAISVIRRELFIFKGKYLWRIGEKGLYMGYPSLIKNMWNKLPQNFTHADAVYERFDRKIVFFVGREIYVFDAHTLINGYPKPLTALGLPSSLDHIDAAVVWGHNSKTYFFSGTMYWRFDDEIGRVELDYPRDMSIWRGVDYNIDAGFQWKDGVTYFFKGKGFWKFDDARMRVANEQLIPSAHVWMGCPKKLENRPADDYYPNQNNFNVNNVSGDASSSSRYIFAISVAIIIVIILIFGIPIAIIRNRKTHSYLRPQKMVR